MGKRIELTGRTFGRLTVTSNWEVRKEAGKYDRTYWECKCSCGNTKWAKVSNLMNGTTKSCGCLRRSAHGHGTGSRSPTYQTWKAVKDRSFNKAINDYARYGNEGIVMCERWLTFANFLEDMGERPEGCTLDRIDNTKGYYKENCRWATIKQQARNRRTTILTMAKARNIRKSGLSQTKLAKKYGVSVTTISDIQRNVTWREEDGQMG